MSYQPQYHPYTQAIRPAHHWLDLLVKVGVLLTGVTTAAVIGVHMIHKYSPPTSHAPVAQIVKYFGKGGLGAMGANQHWTMEASEGSREWRRAVRYCQAQAQAQAQNTSWSGASAGRSAQGCSVINTLAESGY